MSKKRSQRYICPFCYGSIDMSQVHYACNDPLCTRTFLGTCTEAEKRRYGSVYRPEEEIDVERSEFLGLDPYGSAAVTTKSHIIRGSVDGKCEICGSRNTDKLCPRCHHKIIKAAERWGTSIYVLVGSESVGKSHYLASLIETLKSSYAQEFGVTVTASTENTADKFDDEYRRTVFDGGRCLPPTPTYGDVLTRDPLLYDLDRNDGDGPRTLAFVDTSGRDLDSTDKLASLNISTFISGAAGIMFFVDAPQLPAVRTKLGLPAEDRPDPAAALNYVAEVIRDKNRLKPKNPVEIPLAVVVTKCDRLMRPAMGEEDEDALFGPESSLHIPREKGQADLDDIALVGTEVEEYLRRNAGQDLLNAVDQFETHQYFAVSALGGEPADGVLSNGVAPYRVEDPMIWFLNTTERRKWL